MLTRAAVRLAPTLRRWPRTDACAFALVLASLALGMALTWQRWGSLLVDCGREMNQPLRLLHGERLYADVSHYYGPLAPVVNAALYRVFGVSLDTLRGAGSFAMLVILAAIYWLARRLMGRAAAALSAISVTWLCALWFSGDYVLPYTYAAVYGLALSLAALVAAERSLRSDGTVGFLLAALLTALALLTKTEMGVAALAGGLTCVLLARIPHWHAAALRAVAFVVVAVGLPIATYVWIAGRIGWTPLLEEGHLLYQNLPLSVVNLNRQVFGLVHPWNSALAMVAVAVRLAAVASLLAWLAMRLRAAQDRLTPRLWWTTVALATAVVVSRLGARWTDDPYLAIPLLLLLLSAFHGRRLWQRLRSCGHAHGQAAFALASAVFALASLARTVMRVRVGGSYRPYLMPAAIMVFTYLWCQLVPALLPRARARRFVRVAALTLLACWTAGVAVTTVRRHRVEHRATLVTPRGVMMTTPAMRRAFAQAIETIESRTRPGDLVAVVPEGTALLFFTDRRNPLHEEITVPGFLYEDRAMAALSEKPVALVLVANRATPEYGAAHFGVDYGQRLMRLIQDRFTPCGRLGDAQADRLRFEAYCAPSVASMAAEH